MNRSNKNIILTSNKKFYREKYIESNKNNKKWYVLIKM